MLDEVQNIIKKFDNKEIGYFPVTFDYCIFLLSEFREKELFPILMDLYNKPDIDYYDVLGDGLFDKTCSIIVSVFNDDFETLNKVIESKDVDGYIRSFLLRCYVYFYEHRMVSKEDLESYLKKLIDLFEYEYDEIYNGILDVIIDTHLFDMIEDVKTMFENDVIELELRGDYDSFIDDIFDYNDLLDRFEQTESVEDMMSHWYCFNKSNDSESDKLKDFSEYYKKYVKEELDELNDNPYKDIGRNDPCPCGSGKKYKKCCLDKIKANEVILLPYQKYINESLRKYPKVNINKNEINFYDFYKKEYIEIDKLLYKVLVHKAIPLFIKRNYLKENEINLKYLETAYELIKCQIQEHKFKTIDEYDNEVSIHYSLHKFYDKYTEILMDNILKNVDVDTNINKLEKTVKYFYDNFDLNNAHEHMFIYCIHFLYNYRKQYKKGFEYFNKRLDDCLNRYSVYESLFYFISKIYKHDEAIKLMDDYINKEKDINLKNDLREIRYGYID